MSERAVLKRKRLTNRSLRIVCSGMRKEWKKSESETTQRRVRRVGGIESTEIPADDPLTLLRVNASGFARRKPFDIAQDKANSCATIAWRYWLSKH
jgi:hypothetical protein